MNAAGTQAAHEAAPTEVDVLIAGAGFAGLGTAIRLKQAGLDDFLVLERAAEVGGVWWANTYPGCGCDVPSHLYSFSFAPNPDWSLTYSPQTEIGAYLRRCADEFGIRPHLRLGHEVRSAAWNEGEQRWDVETSGGSFRARVIVSAMGPLTEPKFPDLPGLDRFEGRVFHSARWDHDFDLSGKRIASIGTGASAIQYVPEIAPEVERLHVFQRTAPWVMPHPGRRISRVERRLYRRFPLLQKLNRAGVYAARELLVLGFVKNPKLMGVVERMARKHIREQISDPELVEKVTPDYTIGCKRILPSNNWYPALCRDNVELVTGGVAEVRERSVVGPDGVEREVDAIVFGTGFHVTDMPAAKLLRGRDGRTLAEAWAEAGFAAHRGTTVTGFPNLFLLLGPNTGLGHNSIVYMIESQIAYLMDALRTMRERGAETVEVLPEAQDGWNRAIDERMGGTVWNTGCASWYLDEHGRNVTLWPDWTFRFRQKLARFDAGSYALGAARKPAGREAVAA